MSVQQLSGVDASFLNMETSTQFGHVASLVMVDPSTSATGDVYGDLRTTFEARLHLLGVYRRKLATVPFDLDLPYWVDDPDLDVDFHLREIGLPKPGSRRLLADQVARIMARPLDRSRPLWEWYVISGLEDGQVAILTKLHHATVDGVSGVELLHVLLDHDPEGSVVPPPSEPWRPSAPPSTPELLARTAWSYATRPQKAVRLQVQLLRAAAELTGNPAARQMVAAFVPGLRRVGLLPTRRSDERPTLPNQSAPRTPFNRTITPHRRVAFETLPLEDAKRVRRALDVTVNDIVLAVCASALRRYLIDHDALPAEPLIAMVPVSVRDPASDTAGSNRVSGVLCPLHTDVEDPVERLRAIHESMAAAKEMQRAIPADMLSDMSQLAPPALAARAARLATGVRMADRLNPPFNLVVSNVPGPREPLYLSGARMTHFFPVSAVAEGQGLNMTVQSYLGNLDFGLTACRELVPDLWNLAGHLAPGLEELVTAAGS
jgi:diacylglycerol O-acyltransferase / wax synthase